jgi:hypothetical protein
MRSRKSQATNGIRTVDADIIMEVTVWLDGVNPMAWRRVQVPGSIMQRE